MHKDKNLPQQVLEMLTEGILFKSIEITYICTPNMQGQSKITMTVNSSDCGKFNVSWIKSCDQKCK